LVYYGLWFAPLREALDGFFNVAQQRVTGAVGLKVWKGTLHVTKRVSPFSLYRADLASFTMAATPQGRRGLYQFVRAARNGAPESKSRRK